MHVRSLSLLGIRTDIDSSFPRLDESLEAQVSFSSDIMLMELMEVLLTNSEEVSGAKT